MNYVWYLPLLNWQYPPIFTPHYISLHYINVCLDYVNAREVFVTYWSVNIWWCGAIVNRIPPTDTIHTTSVHTVYIHTHIYVHTFSGSGIIRLAGHKDRILELIRGGERSYSRKGVQKSLRSTLKDKCHEIFYFKLFFLSLARFLELARKEKKLKKTQGNSGITDELK